jgi:hypothetical protein
MDQHDSVDREEQSAELEPREEGAEAPAARDELSPAEMEAESGAALPDREAMSLLNLDVNIDLDADAAAPVAAAIAANANVAAPIDAA